MGDATARVAKKKIPWEDTKMMYKKRGKKIQKMLQMGIRCIIFVTTQPGSLRKQGPEEREYQEDQH
jgi:hypothetical protein